MVSNWQVLKTLIRWLSKYANDVQQLHLKTSKRKIRNCYKALNQHVAQRKIWNTICCREEEAKVAPWSNKHSLKDTTNLQNRKTKKGKSSYLVKVISEKTCAIIQPYTTKTMLRPSNGPNHKLKKSMKATAERLWNYWRIVAKLVVKVSTEVTELDCLVFFSLVS